ncbi:hypothetical protein VitviT2T_015270 [Vitis vinifera]|uniref:non-specific serine/threonine protein kinase n=1 Tax=Vitis vinifera TaxID=29760 RepID=A0ABY9CNK5_VITVI|nr:probable LRR receptor-like serine/threonine-protein kinase At1g29720 [Vitis vinifera]WJZ96600.1 hypothetical protein VitviT2T_015270 [Vitis vinifera]|eukprot:XP_010655588.1 PREDICTED: probable LRR receptor-like serine/threonine-protein kinase At1g29720 isoform X1 [Vitis vinifera]
MLIIMFFCKKCPRLLLFCLITLSISCFRSVTCAQLPAKELEALQQIVTKMGAKWLNSSADPCTDEKLPIPPHVASVEDKNNTVFCNCFFDNQTTCHITTIFLKSYSLNGTLPPELVQLPYLQKLDLTRNCLQGKLPIEWASMTSLNFISLTANNLSGEIPVEWGSFTNLTYLSFEANRLSGNIPQELGNLANLTVLILSSNKFVGNLTESLAGLKNLQDFRISDNNFTGSIPHFVESWTQLQRLQTYASGLEGPIPDGIFRLEKLTDLRITDMNGTSFTLPQSLGNQNDMRYLVLRNLNMSGTIPDFIWQMDNLLTLDFTFNKLEGEIPGTARIPKFTLLTGNRLSGNLSNSILGTISVSDKSLDLSYNNFTWPVDCQEIQNINRYQSSSQKYNLSGLLPCSTRSRCTKPRDSLHINCGGANEIIKNNFGSIKYEGDIDGGGSASRNFISTNWGFSSTGDFMDDDSDDGEKYIESNSSVLSMNHSVLYMTARKAPLSLTYFGFCLKNGDYNVRLHFAEIEFKDEEAYSKLGRRIFNIYIQGKLVWEDFNIMEEANGIGKEVIKQSNVTVTNNTLEIRLYWAGKGTTCIPKRGRYGPLISAISICPSSRSHCGELGKGSKKVTIVGVATSVSCLILFVLGVLCWKYYFGGKNMMEKELRGLDLQTGSFTLRQIKAATNNFDYANKIGEGGFGSVYKGQLSDGTVIAVKQLSSKSRQGNREFVNEIGIISCLHHPNLVKLYGCCIEGNQLLLVYEYMENNSLARALFERSVLKLDWATRYKICVGIAKGLTFLHEESRIMIVHRDIKATNVLLDENLNAKISDFGLAKLNEGENTHISTRIAGTIGYMAPEYALWGYLTDKADVYSFGVVTLEIVSGKNNSNYTPDTTCTCLLDWAFVLKQKGSLMELVDPNLGTEFNKKEAETMIKVALLCTNASSKLRPTMSAVLRMLEGQDIIPEVISDPSIYGKDMRISPLRDHYQHMEMQSSSGSLAPNFSLDGAQVGSSSSA